MSFEVCVALSRKIGIYVFQYLCSLVAYTVVAILVTTRRDGSDLSLANLAGILMLKM